MWIAGVHRQHCTTHHNMRRTGCHVVRTCVYCMWAWNLLQNLQIHFCFTSNYIKPQPTADRTLDKRKHWMCRTVRMKAPSDSPDQSSNAPLIAQEVRRHVVTLSPSLISYQTHSSNKCAIFPATELQGRRWLMRMWSLLYWCGKFLWREQRWRFVIDCRGQWVSGYQFGLSEGAGIWGSHISCSGSKGNFREWCDKDRWCWKLVCACCTMCWTDIQNTSCTHSTYTEALFVLSLYRERQHFWS